MNDNVSVSVICNAYNHGKYIKDALDGFVMQKTNFVFEVLIHDDASTDNTADIIREYEAKYPDIIKPIYQTENQYTKGGVSRFQIPRVKGKYVAICEGDDCWTDPYKLQKQFDALEAHPEIDMCAHTAQKINAETGKKAGEIKPSAEDTVFSTEQTILGGGGFVACASLFFRSDLYRNVPEFKKFLSLDYTLQIQGSLRGGLLYLSDCMSVYRVGVAGSWTKRMNADPQKFNKHLEKEKTMLEILNRETEFKYNDAIKKRILRYDFHLLINTGEFKKALSKEYKELIDNMSRLARFKLKIKATFPFLVKILRKI